MCLCRTSWFMIVFVINVLLYCFDLVSGGCFLTPDVFCSCFRVLNDVTVTMLPPSNHSETDRLQPWTETRGTFPQNISLVEMDVYGYLAALFVDSKSWHFKEEYWNSTYCCDIDIQYIALEHLTALYWLHLLPLTFCWWKLFLQPSPPFNLSSLETSFNDSMILFRMFVCKKPLWASA